MKLSAKNYALKLLTRRDRSEGEVREKLIKKEFPETEIKQTIDFLRKNNFINDQRFAENYILSQVRFKPQGKRRLFAKLKSYKVSREVIEEAIKNIDIYKEEKLAEKACRKWTNKYGAASDYKKRERLMRHLVLRGFGYDIIIRVIEEFK